MLTVVGLWHEHGDVSPKHFLRRVTEKARSGGADQFDQALFIDNDDRVIQGVKNGAHPLLALMDPCLALPHFPKKPRLFPDLRRAKLGAAHGLGDSGDQSATHREISRASSSPRDWWGRRSAGSSLAPR